MVSAGGLKWSYSMTSRLSPNFNLSEFTFSQTATRHNINNDPSPEIIARLVQVAHQMERVRVACGNRPIRISSGYRSPELNRRIGGSASSAHMQGWAVDFTVSGQSVVDTIKDILEVSSRFPRPQPGISFDQVINEGGRWVHISFAPAMRQQVLTATFTNGKATYTKGLT